MRQEKGPETGDKVTRDRRLEAGQETRVKIQETLYRRC